MKGTEALSVKVKNMFSLIAGPCVIESEELVMYVRNFREFLDILYTLEFYIYRIFRELRNHLKIQTIQ